MSRNRVAWMLSLPLSATGMLLAHHVGWQLASPEHGASSSHGYLQYCAVFAALGAATVLVGATAQLLRAVGGGDVDRPPSAPVFAIVPVVGFLIQEHLEHLAASRELEVTVFLSKPFLLGLALQLPFALAAFVVAHLILGFVRRLARALGALPRLGALASLAAAVPFAIDLLPRPALALRRAGRAPPLLA